jgi:uncharacterized protein (DUF4415 family)
VPSRRFTREGRACGPGKRQPGVDTRHRLLDARPARREIRIPFRQLAERIVLKAYPMSEDFRKGKRGPVIRLDPTKLRIPLRLDAGIVEHFKKRVHQAGGGNYQTLINDALRRHIRARDKTLEDALRRVIREELKKAG